MLISTPLTEPQVNALYAKARERANQSDPYWGPIYNALDHLLGVGEHPDVFNEEVDLVPEEVDMMPKYAQPGYSKSAVRALSSDG